MAVENRATILNDVLSAIYNDGDLSTAQKSLYELYNKNFRKAVDGVFKNPEAGSVVWEKAQQFRHNASRFALYKADRHINELVAKTVGIKDKAKRLKAGRAVNAKYMRFQGVEYAAMTTRARSSLQLLQFEKTKHIYPNLEWIMTRSVHPREDHLALVGLILPIDHPFWEEHQPGNEYGCKCDWKRTREPATANIPDVQYRPSKGLEGNPNATGLLINDNHPYFQVPEETRARLDKELSKMIRSESTRYGRERLTGTDTIAFIAGKETRIAFTNSGINHFIHDYHEHRDFKNMMVPFLAKLIEKAKYIASGPNTKPENAFVKQYHYLEIQVLGKPSYFNIRETVDGKHSLYAITDKLK